MEVKQTLGPVSLPVVTRRFLRSIGNSSADKYDWDINMIKKPHIHVL